MRLALCVVLLPILTVLTPARAQPVEPALALPAVTWAPSGAVVDAPSNAAAAPAPPDWSEAAADVVLRSLGLLGVRYRKGGNTPDHGLDCSGMVRYVFEHTLGIALPRQAWEMSRLGERIERQALQPGDLLFFNTMRRAYSHVAIYIGEGRFVHAPATGGRVRIEALHDTYWTRRFDGARRLAVSLPAAP